MNDDGQTNGRTLVIVQLLSRQKRQDRPGKLHSHKLYDKKFVGSRYSELKLNFVSVYYEIGV